MGGSAHDETIGIGEPGLGIRGIHEAKKLGRTFEVFVKVFLNIEIQLIPKFPDIFDHIDRVIFIPNILREDIAYHYSYMLITASQLALIFLIKIQSTDGKDINIFHQYDIFFDFLVDLRSDEMQFLRVVEKLLNLVIDIGKIDFLQMHIQFIVKDFEKGFFAFHNNFGENFIAFEDIVLILAMEHKLQIVYIVDFQFLAD